MFDDPMQRHRRARKSMLTWWLLLTFVFALFALAMYLTFGPDPPIVISPATTHITSPLDADGRPDYAAALRAELSNGVTPENNGAIPYLEAMWPEGYRESFGEAYDPEMLAALRRELGMGAVPDDPLFPLDTPERRLAAARFLKKRLGQQAAAAAPPQVTMLGADGFGEVYRLSNAEFLALSDTEAAEDQRAIQLIYACQPVSRPWTASDLPFVAEWLDRHDAAIDRLRVAGARSGWYLPDPPLIDPAFGKLNVEFSTNIQLHREAARILFMRSFRFLGEGQHGEAVEDAVTILRLASHFAKQPFLVDQLVATAIDGIGLSAANRIASDAATPPSALRTLLRDLATVGPWMRLAPTMDLGERYYDLASVLSARSDWGNWNELEDAALLLGGDNPIERRISSLLRFALDWNPVLQSINESSDRYAAAANAKTARERIAQFQQIETELNTAYADQPWADWLTAQGRGRIAALTWQAYFGGSMYACITAQERTRTQRAITQLAIAVAIYRAEDGAPPDDLDALVPGILAEIPRDPFGDGKPLRYRRTDDGFLIWSVGLNGRDDGGSRDDGFTRAYEGVEIDSWLDPTSNDLLPQEKQAIDLMEKIPEGADDPSLRFPLPVAPWPWEDIGL